MPNFNCPTCGATFANEAEWKQHGPVHMRAGPSSASLECKACGSLFGSEPELMAHSRGAHPM